MGSCIICNTPDADGPTVGEHQVCVPCCDERDASGWAELAVKAVALLRDIDTNHRSCVPSRRRGLLVLA